MTLIEPIESLSCSLTFNAPRLEGKLKILSPTQLFRRNLSNRRVSAGPTGGSNFFQKGIMLLQTEGWGEAGVKEENRGTQGALRGRNQVNRAHFLAPGQL